MKTTDYRATALDIERIFSNGDEGNLLSPHPLPNKSYDDATEAT